MTLTINDTRNNQKGLLWDALEAGHVYIDKNGWYVIGTDHEYILHLSTGELISPKFYSMSYDEFLPVKAKLEIFG